MPNEPDYQLPRGFQYQPEGDYVNREVVLEDSGSDAINAANLHAAIDDASRLAVETVIRHAFAITGALPPLPPHVLVVPR